MSDPESLRSVCENLRHLHFDRCRLFADFFLEILKHCSDLETLNFSGELHEFFNFNAHEKAA